MQERIDKPSFEHDIRRIFSKPIVLTKIPSYCPNCFSRDWECVGTYYPDEVTTVRIYECNFCGGMWEVIDQN